MDGKERRKKIIGRLLSENNAVSASVLAAEYGVTRQIIVSDIALLRANGYKIEAERRGYYIGKENDGIYKTVICRHDAYGVLNEFYAVVDNGGSVLNVIVEHPIYGQISADINVKSRYDAEEFVEKTRVNNASHLCDLTGGLHIHTLSVPDEKAYERICKRLSELNIMVDNAEN